MDKPNKYSELYELTHTEYDFDRIIRCVRSFGIAEVKELFSGGSRMLLAKVAGLEPKSMLLCFTIRQHSSGESFGQNSCDTQVLRQRIALTALLTAIRRWSEDPPGISLELLIIVAGKESDKCSKYLNADCIQSKVCFAFDEFFDSDSITLSASQIYKVTAEFSQPLGAQVDRRVAGLAAKNAINELKKDFNYLIQSEIFMCNSADDTQADSCRIEIEIKPTDDQTAPQQIIKIIDSVYDSACKTQCDVECESELLFSEYQHSPTSLGVAIAERAFKYCSRPVAFVKDPSGSVVNHFNAYGRNSVLLSVGANPESNGSVTKGIQSNISFLQALVLKAGDSLLREGPDS